MNSHNNARLTPRGREQMARAVVDNGLSIAIARFQYFKDQGPWRLQTSSPVMVAWRQRHGGRDMGREL